jgi:hypothetical protein
VYCQQFSTKASTKKLQAEKTTNSWKVMVMLTWQMEGEKEDKKER